jgi:hypothetical protein
MVHGKDEKRAARRLGCNPALIERKKRWVCNLRLFFQSFPALGFFDRPSWPAAFFTPLAA